MFPLLTDPAFDPGAAIAAGATAVAVILIVAVANRRQANNRPTIRGAVKKFLGTERFRRYEFHEKTFPGYDLASTNFAIESFLNELCQWHQAMGTVAIGLNLQSILHSSGPRKSTLRFLPPTFTRLPIDVSAERSFPSNMLWLLTVKPGVFEDSNGSPPHEPERLVILLRSRPGAFIDSEDLNVARAPSQILELVVMCASRSIADQFFAQIEDRRKKLSVFRGKVVDPILSPGGIHTIAFRQIQPVAEDDLILPRSVKSLIRGSIVDFYNHRDTLQALGVELKRGILFFSPPGTGKTSICLYLAGLLPHFTICFVAGRKLLHPRELCSMAR